ncbi:arginine--tRNA ligase [Deinococcus radiomollis]|uniref:arginine--tRNA ligase n=1 Tax=Deinococcus radiomollis TaxID=468916 RepID=UPI0038927CB9
MPTDLKTQLKQAVEAAAQKLGAAIDAVIQETPAGKPGDYGTPAAFLLAKALRQNPAAIAGQLAASVILPAGIARAEAVGPYLNFFVDAGEFVRSVVQERPSFPHQPDKVIIEHTSVNPNKELHVGHVRNVTLGDSMARIFRAAGYRVEVQNYIDDTGKQAAESLFAQGHYGLSWDGVQKYDQYMGEGYVRLNADVKTPEMEAGVRAIIHRLETGELRGEIERIVEAHLDTCFRLGARYDLLNWESDVVGSGFLSKAMSILEESHSTSHPQEGKFAGAFVMDVSKFMPGLEEPNVVLMRSDGSAMYAAKDIGYQFWKFGLFEGMKFKPFTTDPDGKTIFTSHPQGEPDTERRFGHASEVINVIDTRQEHPQRVVAASLGVAWHPEQERRSIHLNYAFVTFEGQTISGRKGVGASADAVIDEAISRSATLFLLKEGSSERQAISADETNEAARRIGIGALRFAMLKSEPTRTLDFRWDQVLSLQGDTAPYVQYAAVRAANILKKAAAEGFSADGADWAQVTPLELELAKVVARFPDVVTTSVRVHSPHVVAQYALDLATAFNSWYNARGEDGKPVTNVLLSPAGLRESRLALVERLQAAMEETLGLLGIQIPSAM